MTTAPTDTPPDNPEPQPADGGLPPHAKGWPEWAWKRFENVNEKYRSTKTALSTAEQQIAELNAKIEALSAAPEPQPAPTPKEADTPMSNQPETPPAADPRLDTLTSQIEALTQMVQQQQARADKAERASLLANQGVTDPTVQSYLLRDYETASKAENAPAFSDWLTAQREHPLYKHHLTPADPQPTPADPAQPLPTNRPNNGRSPQPPAPGANRFSEASVLQMTEADRLRNAGSIADQLVNEGKIRPPSERLRKLLDRAT